MRQGVQIFLKKYKCVVLLKDEKVQVKNEDNVVVRRLVDEKIIGDDETKAKKFQKCQKTDNAYLKELH